MLIDDSRMLAFKAFGDQLISNDPSLSKLDRVRLAIDSIRYICGMPPISTEALQKIKSGR
jgi:hypothetical protein